MARKFQDGQRVKVVKAVTHEARIFIGEEGVVMGYYNDPLFPYGINLRNSAEPTFFAPSELEAITDASL